MKKALNRNGLVAQLSYAIQIVVMLFYPALAVAGPGDATVESGSATVTRPDANTTIVNQTSDRAVIRYNGFNINLNELVKINQPNSKSAELIRDSSGAGSSVLGQLVSNGRVFMVNPNGIVFGAGSKIDVAGLMATTFNISNDNFMKGNYTFEQQSAQLKEIINKGTIHVTDGGFVMLVAPAVSNEGLIIANLGKVVLGTGQKVTLDFNGDGLINYQIDGKVLAKVTGPDGKTVDTGVSNSGTVTANGGLVVLHSEAVADVFSSLVNNSGVIEAHSLQNSGGVVRLQGSDPLANTGNVGAANNLNQVHNGGNVIDTGKIDVSSVDVTNALLGKSGEVTISGANIYLSGQILANGARGSNGGKVELNSTTNTIVAASASISVNGGPSTSGGSAVVWSDTMTQFFGKILGTGGANGGNGGKAEVSGHSLVNRGTVDLRAPKGTMGTLLLDPLNTRVHGGAPTDGDDTDASAVLFTGAGGAGNMTFAEPPADAADPYDIFESEIEAQSVLSNIQIRSTTGFSTDAAATFIGANVLLAVNSNLTIEVDGTGAAGAIVLDVPFLTQGTGSITVNGSTAGPFATDITINALGGLEALGSGNVSVDTNLGNILINGLVVTTANGTLLTLNADAGTFTAGATGTVAAGGIGTTTANLVIRASGAITDTAGSAIAATGNASITSTASDIMLNDSEAFGSLTFSGANVLISENDGVNLTGANVATGTLNLASETDSIVDVAGTSLAATGNAVVNSAAGDIILGNSATDIYNFTANATFTASGNIDLGSNGLGAASGAIMNFGSLSFSGTNVTIIETSSTDLTDFTNVATAPAILNAGSNLLLVSTGAITDQADTDVTVGGNAIFRTTGAGASITLANAAADTYTIGLNATFQTTNAALGNIFFGTNAANADSGAVVTAATLSFFGNNVEIFLDGAVVLADNSSSASPLATNTAGGFLHLRSTTSSITDLADTDVVVNGGPSIWTAAGIINIANNAADSYDIFPGGNTFDTGGAFDISVGSNGLGAPSGAFVDIDRVSFNGFNVEIEENFDFLILDDVSSRASALAVDIAVGTLLLRAVNDITDAVDTDVTVGGATAQFISSTSFITLGDDGGDSYAIMNQATFTAATDILVGVTGVGAPITDSGAAVNFGSLLFNSASGNARIFEDSAMGLVDGSTAATAALATSAGDITDFTGGVGVNFTGTSLFLQAAGGIGTGDSIDVDVQPDLEATAAAGIIDITDIAGEVRLDSWFTGDNVAINASGTITIAGSGSFSFMTVRRDVFSAAGNINLIIIPTVILATGDSDIYFGDGVGAGTDGYAPVSVSAPAGSITAIAADDIIVNQDARLGGNTLLDGSDPGILVADFAALDADGIGAIIVISDPTGASTSSPATATPAPIPTFVDPDILALGGADLHINDPIIATVDVTAVARRIFFDETDGFIRTTGTVTLTATGDAVTEGTILDTLADADLEIIAPTIVLNAAGGPNGGVIRGVNAIDVDVSVGGTGVLNGLTAVVTGTGDIRIDDGFAGLNWDPTGDATPGMTIRRLDTFDGNILVDSTRLDAVANVIPGNADMIVLSPTNVFPTNGVIAGSGAIATPNGNVTLRTINSGIIQLGTVLPGGGSRFEDTADVTAYGDSITLDALAESAPGLRAANGSGSITDVDPNGYDNGSHRENIRGTNLELLAFNGVGLGTNSTGILLGNSILEVDLFGLAGGPGFLSGRFGAGGFFLKNFATSGLTLGVAGGTNGVSQRAPGVGGNVNITADDAAMTIAADMVSAGNILLFNPDSATFDVDDRIRVNAGIHVASTGGFATLRAGDNVELAAGATVAGATTTTLTAGFGDNDFLGTIALRGAVGTDVVNAVNSVTVNMTAIGGINFGNGATATATGAMTLRADSDNDGVGSIIDADAGVDATAATLTMSAATGIDIDTNVTTLNSASLSQLGGTIDINELDGAGNGLAIGTINAAGGTVNLANLNAFTDANGNATNVTADTLTIAAGAGTSFGILGNAIETVVDSVSTTGLVGGPNGFFMKNTGDLTIAGVSATGDVNIEAASNITITAVVASAGAVTLTSSGDILTTVALPADSVTAGTTASLFAGGADGDIGSVANPIGTTSTTLVLGGTGSGDIFVTESDGATVTATTGSGSINLVSTVGAFDVAGASTMGTLNLTASGAAGGITDSGTLAIGGTTTLNGGANAITLDTATNDFTTVTFAGSTGAATLVDRNAIDLGGTGASTLASLNVTASGNITQSGALLVTSLSVAAGIGGNITLNNAANDFGTVSVGSGLNVNLRDLNAIILGTSIVTGNLDVRSGGAVGDNISESGVVTVAGTATFTAGLADVVLNTQPNDFATVAVVSSANSSFRDANGILLGSINTTAALVVTTDAGPITSTLGSSIIVGTTATFTAPGFAINVGTQAGDTFTTGAVTVNGVDVTIDQDSPITFTGVSLVTGNLIARSLGAITNDATADLTVVGNASFTGASIDLNVTTPAVAMNFGTLTFNSVGAVSISETSGTTLAGVSTAAGLVLTSAAALTNNATANVTVTGNASLTGTSIDLNATTGAVAMNFGTLTFNSVGAVSIGETSGTTLTGVSTAASLVLTSSGVLTNDATANLVVGANASFTGASIDLNVTTGAVAMTFGTLTFNSVGAVSISETDGTTLAGVSTAASLLLTSAAALTNDATADVTVTGNANLTGTSIDLNVATGAVAMDFGTLTFNSVGAVSISETSGTELTGVSTAGAGLSLTAAGPITNTVNASLTVTGGNASFNAAGFDITLGTLASDTMNFVTLTVVGVNVTVAEDSAMAFTGVNTVTGNLAVSSTADITDVAGTTFAVTGNASFTAATTIVLGDDGADVTNFGSLTLNAVDGTVTEDSSMVFAGASVLTGFLTVSAAGSITDTGSVFVGTTLTADATAAGGVTLDSITNDAATIDLSAVGGSPVTFVDANGFTVENVTTLGGAVSLTALAGAIVSGGSPNDVTGLSLVMSATTGIGALGNEMLTVVSSLAAVTDTGGIFVTNTGALDVTTIGSVIGATAQTGDIRIIAQSPLTISAIVSTADDVLLQANEGGDNANLDELTINAVVEGHDITLNAGDDVIINATVTASNDMFINAGDGVYLNAFIYAAGLITITTGGAVFGADDTAASCPNGVFFGPGGGPGPGGIFADDIVLSVAGDITLGILKAINTVTVTASGAGSDIFFGDTVSGVQGLVISGTSTTLTADGDILFRNSVTTPLNPGDPATFIKAGTLLTMTATNGQILDTEADALTVADIFAPVVIATAGTGITYDGQVDVLTSATVTGAGAGSNVNITDLDNLVVGTVSTNNLSSVTLTTGGAIIDGNSAAVNNVTGGSLVANTGTGVNLNTNIVSGGTLTASVSGDGNIDVRNVNGVGALTVTSATIGGLGSTIITTDGSMLATLVTTANGDITLSATQGILFTTITGGGSGSTVTLLNVGGAAGEDLIGDAGGPGTGMITANKLVMDNTSDGIDVDTTVRFLEARSTDLDGGGADGNDDLVVRNVGALTIGLAGAQGFAGVSSIGAVNISAASPITVAANVTGVLTVTLTAGESPTADADNLTINAGVLVESTSADFVLSAGDNVNILGTARAVTSSSITAGAVDAGDGGSITSSNGLGLVTLTGAGAVLTVAAVGNNRDLGINLDANVQVADLDVTGTTTGGIEFTNTRTTSLGTLTSVDADTAATTGIGSISLSNTGSALTVTTPTTVATTGNGDITVLENGGALTVTTLAASTGTLTTGTADVLISGEGGLTTVTTANAGGATTTSGSATMEIDSTGGLTVTTANTRTATGDAELNVNSSGGAVSLGTVSTTATSGDASMNVDATGGTLAVVTSLTTNATSGEASLAINHEGGTTTVAAVAANVTTGVGTIDINGAGGAVSVTSAVATATAGGNSDIHISATSADLTATTITSSGADGDINLTTLGAGNINIDTLTAAGGRVTLDSTGNVNDDEVGTTDITAIELVAITDTGFGTSASPIDTVVSAVEGNGGTGGFFQNNTGPLTIGGLTGAVNGVVAQGDVAIRNATAGAAITDPMVVTENVTSTTGSVTLTVADSTGNFTDDILINPFVTVTAGTFALLQAGDDIAIAGIVIAATTATLNAGNADTGDLGGSILDLNDTAENVIANTLVASAFGNDNSGLAISIDSRVVNLTSATVTPGTGGIRVEDTQGGMILTGSATTVSGSITLSATGGDLNIRGTGVTAGGVGANIILNTFTGLNVSGNINLGDAGSAGTTGLLTATGDLVELNSVGGVFDTQAAETADESLVTVFNNIDATNLIVRSVAGFGTAANSIETTVVTVAGRLDTGGWFQVDRAGGLTVGTLTTVEGNLIAGIQDTDVTNGFFSMRIQALSPLTIAANILMTGNIDLTADEVADPGVCADDFTLLTGVTIQSTQGNIGIFAGDDVLTALGSTIHAFGSVTVRAGFDADEGDLDGCGAATLLGTIISDGGAGSPSVVITALQDIILGLIIAPNGLSIFTQDGDILDGNGPLLNIVANGVVTLTAVHGVIGLPSDCIEVQVLNGQVIVNAGDAVDRVSVNLCGVIEPDGRLFTANGDTPGLILFNNHVQGGEGANNATDRFEAYTSDMNIKLTGERDHGWPGFQTHLVLYIDDCEFHPQDLYKWDACMDQGGGTH